MTDRDFAEIRENISLLLLCQWCGDLLKLDLAKQRYGCPRCRDRKFLHANLDELEIKWV